MQHYLYTGNGMGWVYVWHDPSPYADDHELKLCTLQNWWVILTYHGLSELHLLLVT